MARPILDAEWYKLITERNPEAIPDDLDLNRKFYETWHEENGKSPHGCSLHPAFHDRPEGPHWQCKFSIGGQQRILGYGTCYQMAVLYDVVKMFFAKYRPKHREYDAWTYNFSESENKARLQEPCDTPARLYLRAFLENTEALLLKRGELTTSEGRKLKRKERRHRYTTAGQMRYAIENILAVLEQHSTCLASIEQHLKRLSGEPPIRQSAAEPPPIAPEQSLPPNVIQHSPEEIADGRIKLSAGQNQVIETVKLFFAANPEVTAWTGTTTDLGRLVKSTVFRYNTNQLAGELIQLQTKYCLLGNWTFSREFICKAGNAVQQ